MYIKCSRQCLTTFPNNSNLVKNTLLNIAFSTLFSVFGNVVKHSLLCFIYYVALAMASTCTLPLAHHTSHRHVIVLYYIKRLLKSELFTEYVQRVIGMGNGSWILHSWFCLCVLQLISSYMYVPEVGAFDPIKHSLLTFINCSDCFTSKAAGL